ncbi:flagellar basal body rod protein FlgB [Vagococcus fluvialis]|jgi:flagellar basal-body rod protein FlgB|uniref:flagellar basal body rod protein FlgB n=1 Tax=Vagococcus fluvialis TaxID=2738 RepID=UPI001A90516E|nr:flagellar basal body rod protein FlgB [Vagococcus fluvialis]MBO0429027.1 flagellar basal body rod protein FlgB [Vagococcus fluvialis]
MISNNLSLLKQALNASDLRQKAISNNISNVNTPGYKLERVVFEEKFNRIMSKNEIDLTSTNSKHLSINGENDFLTPEVIRINQTSVKEDGNNVDLDAEMTEKAVNELYYSALTRQVNHELSQMNYVINH